MTKKEKRIEVLKDNPTSLTYDEIESLFKNDDYEIQWGNEVISIFIIKKLVNLRQFPFIDEIVKIIIKLH